MSYITCPYTRQESVNDFCATDTKGNYFTVTYGGDVTVNEIHPTRIDYTGNANTGLAPYASVRFTYFGNTPLQQVSYICGKPIASSESMSQVSMYYGERLIKHYDFGCDSYNGRMRLTSITEYGSGG